MDGNNLLLEIKNEFNYQIDNFNLKDIQEIVNIINASKNNIYFCGVGKSGNIAKHCCDLLKCINISSFYLDILNLSHGDIGTLNNKDIVLMFSNSGNTKELIDIIPLLKIKGIKIICISCNEKSRLQKLCDKTIITPFKKEISGEIDKIPTNSFMSHLIFSNILVSLLKTNLLLDKYKENHLAGDIGKNMLKVKDVLITDYPKIIIENNKYTKININKILLTMTEMNFGCCFFLDKTKKLIAIFTDGDIRKYLLNSNFKNTNIKLKDLNRNFYFESDLDKYLYKIEKKNYIPIIVEEGLKGVVSFIPNHYKF